MARLDMVNDWRSGILNSWNTSGPGNTSAGTADSGKRQEGCWRVPWLRNRQDFSWVSWLRTLAKTPHKGTHRMLAQTHMGTDRTSVSIPDLGIERILAGLAESEIKNIVDVSRLSNRPVTNLGLADSGTDSGIHFRSVGYSLGSG